MCESSTALPALNSLPRESFLLLIKCSLISVRVSSALNCYCFLIFVLDCNCEFHESPFVVYEKTVLRFTLPTLRLALPCPCGTKLDRAYALRYIAYATRYLTTPRHHPTRLPCRCFTPHYLGGALPCLCSTRPCLAITMRDFTSPLLHSTLHRLSRTPPRLTYAYAAPHQTLPLRHVTSPCPCNTKPYPASASPNRTLPVPYGASLHITLPQPHRASPCHR